MTDKDKAAEYDRIAEHLRKNGWSVAREWKHPVTGELHESWFQGDPHSQCSLMQAYKMDSFKDAPRQGERMAETLRGFGKVIDDKKARATTIDMAYDGPADNNPFVPRVGDVVARCAHEPRPLHIHMVAERPVVDGVAVEWMNLCRPCKEREVSGTLMLRTWSEEDAERVRGAGRP